MDTEVFLVGDPHAFFFKLPSFWQPFVLQGHVPVSTSWRATTLVNDNETGLN